MTEEQLKQIQELADKELPTGDVIAKDELFPQAKDPHPPGWMWTDAPLDTYPDNEIDVEEFIKAKQTAKEEFKKVKESIRTSISIDKKFFLISILPKPLRNKKTKSKVSKKTSRF